MAFKTIVSPAFAVKSIPSLTDTFGAWFASSYFDAIHQSALAEADTYEESKIEKNDVTEEMNIGILFSINRELAYGEVVDNIELKGAETSKVEFKVPEDAKVGDTIHIIVEAPFNSILSTTSQ